MRGMRFRKPLLMLVAALLLAPPLAAITVQQMDLAALTQRADRIFRGTVVDVEQSAIAVGDRELPMVVYRLKVEESFKGDADLVKDDQAMIEIRMVGSLKPVVAEGDYARFDIFRGVPRLTMGSDYLLFTTRPGGSGLSTTVGLGQGAFSVFSVDKEDFAVNELNNGGLGFDQPGPISYSEITAKILALLGQ